jgi:hypothetical protein
VALHIALANRTIFDLNKIRDCVPEQPIPIYNGFGMHICKILRPKKLQIYVNVSHLAVLSGQVES